jgi:hypothetical protein
MSNEIYGGPLNNPAPTLGQMSGVGVATGYPLSGPAQSPAMAGAQGKPQVTHIEIRRVQNGFVIMAINIKHFTAEYGMQQPQRWSFVAKDTAELGALLTSIVDGGDIEWLPTYDLPIIDLTRRVQDK